MFDILPKRRNRLILWAARDVFKYLYLRFLDEPLAPEEVMSSIRTGQEAQLGV
jgi:hypothetical protein